MSLIEHAKTELAAINFGEEDSRAMVEILERFFDQWDSGGAVSVAAPVLVRLLNGQPLGPLTGADSEWMEVGPDVFQNVRCGSVFKDKHHHAGEDWLIHDIDAPAPLAAITFPYDPATRMVRPPVYEVETSALSPDR